MRKPLSAETEFETPALSGVFAYRCKSGHIFTVGADEEKAKMKGAAD